MLEVPVATSERISSAHKDYKDLTDCLGIPRNDGKDSTGTVCSILGIEVDTNTFEARLPIDKLNRAIALTQLALTQRSLSLRDAQSLSGFLSFCSQVVQLGQVFMCCIWDFVASYPLHCRQITRRKLPSGVVEDLLWWNRLLPTFNGILYFEEKREAVQLYTDASLQGVGDFYFKGDATHWISATPEIP